MCCLARPPGPSGGGWLGATSSEEEGDGKVFPGGDGGLSGCRECWREALAARGTPQRTRRSTAGKVG